MALDAISVYAPGDTITSAWANLLRGNFSRLDARTGGDPGTANKLLQANGAEAAAWVDRMAVILAALTVPDNANQWLQSSGTSSTDWVDRAAAVLQAIGYTPVNRAGDAGITGELTVTKAGGAVDANLYANGMLELIATSGVPSLGLHTSGVSALTLYEVLNELYVFGSNGVNGKVWHQGNTDGMVTTGKIADSNVTFGKIAAAVWMPPKVASQSSDLTLTTSYSDAAGLSVTLDRNGKWMILGACDLFRAPTGSDQGPVARLLQDGTTPLGAPGAINNATDAQITVPLIGIATVAAGSATVKVQGKKDSGTGASKLTFGYLTAIWISP